ACDARLKDGTLVSRRRGQGFARMDLKPAFERHSTVVVYLAVPKLKLGQANDGQAGNADACRYVASTLSMPDETIGGNDQEIDFRDLSVRLLLSTQDTAGFEVLPIARIKRAEDKEGMPAVDTDWFPPLITVEAWPDLSVGIIRAIYD